MFKQALLLSIVLASLSAEIKFEDIVSKPSGRTKNFMIWQYLRQDITPEQADRAYELVEGNIHKVKKEYLKKSKNKNLLREIECRDKQDLLSIEEKDCFNLAMSPYKTLHLSDKTREELLLKLENKAQIEQVRIQAEPYKESAYKKYEADTILSMFISTTQKHRRGNLDLILSKNFIHHMFSKDASDWRKFALVKIILNDDNLKNLQKSILHIDPNSVNADTNFLLGINHLQNNHTEYALKYLKRSQVTASKRIDQDKSVFWMYQATKKQSYLKELTSSADINIYTLYAHELLKTTPTNYFTSVEINGEVSDKNLCDPFMWDEIHKEIKETPKENLFELAKKYKTKDMAAVQALVLEKAHDFKMHGFIMPYDEHLQELSNDEKALVYALMKQESYLIPSALSRSFALGLMQIMPFVADDLSTRIKNPISCYNDMFEPSYNLKYAKKHITWLKKTFYHPLFIAYSYNGGLGYLRKHLGAKTFQEGKYEPFLSMELMLNKESREYGKRVLSNYVMYKKVLGEKVSIVDLLQTLTDPKKTDRYRSKG